MVPLWSMKKKLERGTYHNYRNYMYYGSLFVSSKALFDRPVKSSEMFTV